MIKRFLKLFLFLTGALAFIFLVFIFFKQGGLNKISVNQCYEERDDVIRGASLEPFLKNGAKVKTFLGYYDCNTFQRGDVVIFKFKTREETFVKKLMGLPGDKLEIKEDKIYLNDEVLTNSQNQPYLADERAKTLLMKPLTEVKIPENYFLILSDHPNPSFDSRTFGLLAKEHIAGKVEY